MEPHHGVSTDWRGSRRRAAPEVEAWLECLFAPISTGPVVTSVAGRSGAVNLTKTDVGLSNVNNTSDVAKPISTAQAAVNAVKADLDGSGKGSAGAAALCRADRVPGRRRQPGRHALAVGSARRLVRAN